MAWTVPDKGEGVSDIQSVLFQTYLDAVASSLEGPCVLKGGAVSPSGGMNVVVPSGAIINSIGSLAVIASSETIGTADATNPRIDLVVVTSAGNESVRAGTPAAAPKPPVPTAGDLLLAAVYVPAGVTSILSSYITDMRVLRADALRLKYTGEYNHGSGTTNVIETHSALVVPGIYFRTGQVLRCRAGGSILNGAGVSMTVTLRISLDTGTEIIYQDTTVANTNTTTKHWYLDFTYTAKTDATQALVGRYVQNAAASDLGTDETLATAPIKGAGTHDYASSSAVLCLEWVSNTNSVQANIITDFCIWEQV